MRKLREERLSKHAGISQRVTLQIVFCRAGLAFLFAFAALFPTFGAAQISPGPLAQAHQNLSGGANCTKCHAVSTRSPEFRCLECHKEIANEIQQNRGLHSTFPRSQVPGAACVKCHSDHNGADFQMVHWNPTASGFDHSKTGYTLDGKHMVVGCRACHTAQHVPQQARAMLG